jgi:hypothetical protein
MASVLIWPAAHRYWTRENQQLRSPPQVAAAWREHSAIGARRYPLSFKPSVLSGEKNQSVFHW